MRATRHELDGVLLAVHVGPEPSKEHGFHMATEHADPLQVGRNRRPKGYLARAHWHPPLGVAPDVPRQEMLHVLSGRVRVDLFASDGRRGPSLTVGPGETVFLVAAHAVEFLEESELLEVKQGPYPGPERDKRFL